VTYAIAGVLILVCSAGGVWLGSWVSVKMGYAERMAIDRRTLLFVCSLLAFVALGILLVELAK
jgi:hypothetical protein